MSKQNDWFAANLNQPNFNLDDMFAIGITPDNTTLKDRDYYKDIKQVKDTFTDKKTGKFNEEAFNDYYDSLSRSFNEFSRTNFVDNWLKSVESSPYDIFSLDNPNTFDADIKMIRHSDPQRHSMGLAGVNAIGSPSFDEREVAQANFVRDENGNKLNWTPNEKGFFGALFGNTLVKATYDKDGYYEENGEQVFHRKGETKYDENGDPYYEILGNRSVYGKDVLHVTDVITDDDSWWNQFDVLDSDSLDKSITKTIFKAAAQIGLYAIPYAGPWIGAAKAVLDLSSVLPIVGKAIDGLFTGNTDDAFGKSMSKWEATMSRFDKSQTQYAKEHQWAWENVADMLSSSAGQLYSQRLIGQIPLLFKNAKGLSDLQKTGQRLSLGYMALTSAEDSYRTFKDAGANDSVAGLGFLATAASLYGLMNIDYFKAWLFKNSNLGFDPEMRFAVRDFAKTKGVQLAKELGLTNGKPVTEAQKKNFVKRLWTGLTDFTTKYKDKLITGKAYPTTLSFANHALNEGIEETMEEVVGDIYKGIAEAAQALGFNVTDSDRDQLEFGWSPEEVFNRYLTSFVGGALGGAVFEGLTRWENYWKNGYGKVDNLLNTPAKRRILWYVSNGYGDDLRKALAREHKLGHLGDKNLSWKGHQTTDASGKVVWTFDSAKDDDNQNDQMFKKISEMIDNIEFQARSLNLLLSDEQTKRMAMRTDDIIGIAEKNMQAAAEKEGLSVEEYKKKHRTSLMERVIEESGTDEAMFSDIWNLKNRILKLQENIENREAKIRENQTDSNKAEIDRLVEQDQTIKDFKSEQKKAQQEYQELLDGKRSSEYFGLAAFAHNNSLRNIYLLRDENDDRKVALNSSDLFAKLKYDKNLDELSDEQRYFIEEEASSFKDRTTDILREAYEIHRRLIDRLDPTVKLIVSEMKDYIMDSAVEDATIYDFYKDWITKAQELLPQYQQSLDAIEDKESNEAKRIQSEINKINTNIEQMQKAIDDSDPSLLSRTLSVNPKAKSFAEGVPESFEVNYDISKMDVDDTLQMLKDYFNYLKSNKIVLAYDNNTYQNVVKNILSAFKMNVDKQMKVYRDAQTTEEDAAECAAKINRIRYDYEQNVIVDPLAESAGSIPRAENLAASFGLIGFYNAKLFRAIQNKLSVGQTLSEDEQNWLTSHSNIKDEDVAKIVDIDDNVVDNDINNLLEDIDSFSQKTSRFFLGVSPKSKDFELMISSFVDIMQRDITDWDTKFQELKSFLLSQVTDDNTKTQLEHNFFDILEGVGEKLKEIAEIKAEVKQSPVTDLLESITIMVEGESLPVLDFLRDEVKSNSSQEKLNEYVMNPNSAKQVEKIKDLLPTLKAVIGSMNLGGFNDFLNNYREKDDKENLTVLDDQHIFLFNRELSYIESRINTLLTISDSHTQSNADRQIDVQINMRPKYMKRFIGNIKDPSLVKKIFDTFGIDTDAHWKEAIKDTDVDVDNVTRENYKAYFDAVRRWEKRIYDEFAQKTKTLTSDEIGKKIGECFENLDNDSGLYNEDETTQPTDLALALYFLSVVGQDPEEWYSIYKTGLNRNEDYPFDNQEMAIRIGFVASQNAVMYSNIVKQIKVPNKNKNKYVENMSTLESLLVILGGNGTGKSKVVLKKIIDLLKTTGKKVDVVATTADPDRLAEMKTELNIQSDDKIVVLSKLVHDLWTKDLNPDDYEDSEATGHPCKLSEESLKKIKTEILNGFYNKDSDIKILALDEGTFASEAELQMLCEAAKQVGVFILLTGDLNQQYALRSFKKGDKILIDTSGLEDCKYGSTPMMTTSMRASNEGMFNNIQLFNIELNKAVQKVKQNPSVGTMGVIPKETSVKIEMQYHETQTAFAGMKVVDDVTEYVKKFDSFSQGIKNKPNVVIITDSDKYDALQNDNVVVLKPEAVQGREFEYAIIDVDLSGDIYEAKFTRLKAINTWLTRARRGSVIANKPRLNESNSFEIASSDVPGAIRTIDAKRDRPEELESYKDWVDDLYSEISNYTAGNPSGPTDTSGNGDSSSGGGSASSGNSSVYIGGAQTVSGNDVEEEIKSVIQEVLDGKQNRSGYKDEEHYKQHTGILNKEDKTEISSDANDLFSLEAFYNWLQSPKSDKYLFGSYKGNIFPKDSTDEQKENYRRFIQTIVYTIASNPQDSISDIIDKKKDRLKEKLNGIDPNVDELLTLLKDSFSNKNDTFGAYKVEPNEDKKTSMLWYAFGNDKHQYIIPIGNINYYGGSEVYTNLNFTQKIPLSLISSEGRVHVPVSRFSKKLHLNTKYGIFAPTVTQSSFSDLMSRSAKLFYESRGRSYNLWNLNIESDDDSNEANAFFTSKFENDNDRSGLIVDFTQSIGEGEINRIAGTHRLVSFPKYVELQRAVQTVMKNEKSTEEINAAQQLLRNTFGINDDEFNILRSGANFYSPSENVEYNANKRLVQRKLDILDRFSRANLSAALLRIAMSWYNSEDQKKSDFAGQFLTNFIYHFLLNENGESKTYQNKEGSSYTNGFNLNFSGESGIGVRLRGSLFIYVNSDGNLAIEVAKDREASDNNVWNLTTDLKASKYLNTETGYNIIEMTRDILTAVQPYLEGVGLWHNGVKLLTEISENVKGDDSDLDFVNSLFSDGTLSILPEKRYNKIAKGDSKEEIRYYGIYDSELINMVPDEPSIYNEIDDLLRHDTIFKYGMYASEQIKSPRNDISQFAIENISENDHLTDICDIMLPAYTIELNNQADNKTRNLVNGLGNINPGEETKLATFESKTDGDKVTFDNSLVVDENSLKRLTNDTSSILNSNKQVTIDSIAIVNGNAELTLNNGKIKTVKNVGKNKIKNWLSELGIEISDTSEQSIVSNGNYHIRWNGKNLTLFNQTNSTNKILNLIGVRTTNNIQQIAVRDGGEIVIFDLTDSILDDLDGKIKSVLNNLIRKTSRFGEYVFSDTFGYYYWSEDDLTFWDGDENSEPAKSIVVSVLNNAILFADGTSISKDEFPDLYNTLYSKLKSPVLESNSEVVKYNDSYSIKGVIISSDWIENNCNTINQSLESDNVALIEYKDNTITVKDNNVIKTFVLSPNGKQWMDTWIDSKQPSIKKGDNNLNKLLNNDRIEIVRQQLLDLINSNPENLVKSINELLYNSAAELGSVFKVDDKLRLSQSRSDDSLAWLTMLSELKSRGVNYEILSTEKSGEIYKFLVSLQTDDGEVVENWNVVKNGDAFKASKIETSDTEIENQIRSEIESTTDENVRTMLSEYLNSHLYNSGMSDELTNWYFDNVDTYSDILNRIDKLNKKAC